MFKPLLISVVGLCLWNCGLFAQLPAIASGQQFPVAAKARYNGKLYPVCEVDDLKPKVMVADKICAADQSPRVRIIPTAVFAPGLVEIEEPKLTFWTEQQESTDGQWRSGKKPLSLSFTGKLTSNTALKDCFIVLVFFRPSTIQHSSIVAPYYLAGVKEVGTLKVGKAKRVRVDYNVTLLDSFPENDFAWFVTVQSGNAQIRSTGAPNAVDAVIQAQLDWAENNK